MPMPPYLRFPENETIQQKIWGLRPRNPTCGKISLETGSKIFAWGNIIFYGLSVVLTAVAVMMLLVTFSNYPTHHQMVQGLKQGNIEFDSSTRDDWIDRMNLKQSHAVLIVVCLLALIFCSALLRLSWKLKKAITERDVPILKRCFLTLLCLELIYILLFDLETEMVWTTAVIFDIAITIFKILGLIFTYSYIVSLINPDDSQNEDMNRIQFSV